MTTKRSSSHARTPAVVDHFEEPQAENLNTAKETKSIRGLALVILGLASISFFLLGGVIIGFWHWVLVLLAFLTGFLFLGFLVAEDLIMQLLSGE